MSTVTYMGREFEIPDDVLRLMEERIDQNVREMTDIADLYAEDLAAERREAEGRTARASAVQDLNGADGSAVYSPGPIVAVPPPELCTVDATRSWELSVVDTVTDRCREMEKRVEEQDRTIADLKSIIENLQDIVYRQKLGKEAETLVL